MTALRGSYLCLEGLDEGLPLGLDDCSEEVLITSVLKGLTSVLRAG